jgi:hypothetical protein
MSQVNGTARPSLALENFQEVENLKLSGSERDKAEETIVGALGSLYAGQYQPYRIDLIEIVLYSWGRYRKSMDIRNQDISEPYQPFLDHFCRDVICRGDVNLS